MKKTFLLAFGLLSIGTFAQNSNPWPTTGNVGIGTASPTVKLDVVNTSLHSLPSSYDLAYFGTRTTGFPSSNAAGLYIRRNSYPTAGFPSTTEVSMTLQTVSGNLNTSTNSYPLSSFLELNPKTTSNASRGAVSFGYQETELMRINRDGKVRIADGTIDLETPTGYRLFVQDGILTEKVKVAVEGTSNWADYVFADNYQLMPLDEVEAFTKENKHLPNVPSAQEMVTEGLDVAQMDAKLLEKVEELTLYLIEQSKKLEAQNEKLEKQMEQMEQQNTIINSLKQEIETLKEAR